MVVQEKIYTIDDLWKLSHRDDGKRYELDEGALIEMSPTGDTHGEVAAEILRLIANHVVANKLGKVSAAETGYTLAKDETTGRSTVRAPDVGFIAQARLTPRTGKYYPVAPDLVVEVISPEDTAAAMRRKAIQYLRAGTRLVWVVYPDERVVDVFRPGQDTHTAENDDVLDCGEVLPGFAPKVSEIFAQLRE
jgi:Uma2 family endonuclease